MRKDMGRAPISFFLLKVTLWVAFGWISLSHSPGMIYEQNANMFGLKVQNLREKRKIQRNDRRYSMSHSGEEKPKEEFLGLFGREMLCLGNGFQDGIVFLVFSISYTFNVYRIYIKCN
jgi:hypothetical protein